jgi:hypothetical protein
MSVFESYVGLLDVAAHRIVHAKVGRKSRESKCRFWCRFVLQNTANRGAANQRAHITLFLLDFTANLESPANGCIL